jgi:hypothetical protein
MADHAEAAGVDPSIHNMRKGHDNTQVKISSALSETKLMRCRVFWLYWEPRWNLVGTGLL